jgi:hypothetical protein
VAGAVLRARQADVTLYGRASCQPLASAFPRPGGGDLRLLILQTLFDANWSELPDLKGRQPQSLRELLEQLAGHLRAGSDAELAVDRCQRSLDRVHGEHEFDGDLPIRPALRDQRRDALFGRCQLAG